MAGESSLFKFLSPGRRFQSTDIQAAAGWGVAAATTALWVIQDASIFLKIDS
ncbi:Ubiquinol-cytochrome c reductase complex 6.7 kDa [Cucumis melo var. makuwa]|uniref:Ubiquinol-cytochrome c reductase complex 6.7 kDa n=1 Tax=Cucumis melo var. makuwa TaxID=1194695 RepID=A0A5D3BZX3_CUCMM|nr:Ubiquinol-cytochrome c reductase complex 6.7 kDa [Cucumis melo var. makuwa]TYK04578.1 Ubiquinol-cytochrome c reductase complex 6.7 kDa [Cucumis melo var. makuwa]